MKLAVIQMHSASDLVANIRVSRELMASAVAQEGVDWLLLPEHFHWAGGGVADRAAAAEVLGDGPAYTMCADFARQHGVFVHAGSIYEKIPGDERIFNTTVVFDRSGAEIVRYRKIHLFDIDAPDGTSYRESDNVVAGDEVVTYVADGVTFGCTICYDLRFPELFRRLVEDGAQVIAVPAAFTLQTGKDHWEPLIRARAIETQTYIAASGSFGTVEYNGHPHSTYGHTMIVDPWGHVVSLASDRSGYIVNHFDPDFLAKTRSDIPLDRSRGLRTVTL